MAEKKGGQDSKKGKPSSAGKRKGKFVNFFGQGKERKLRNLLKNNGSQVARAYASASGILPILRQISAEQTYAGSVARKALKA